MSVFLKYNFVTFFLISTFFDFSFLGFKLNTILILLYLLFSFFDQKRIETSGFFWALSLFVLIYAIHGFFRNFYFYPAYETIQTGPWRPIFIYTSFSIEAFFAFHLIRNHDTRIQVGLINVFFAILISAYFFGILDAKFTKNETGLWANLCLITLVLLKKRIKSFYPMVTPFVSLVTTPSTVALLGVLPFLNKRTLYLFGVFFIIGVLFLFFRSDILDAIFLSKIFLILDPPINDNYGGRYWSNYFYILMFVEKPLFGWGIGSLNHFRELSYNVPLFDHGGADLLMLISSFGVFGTFIFFFLIFCSLKDSMQRRFEYDFLGMIVALLLMLKGVGFLTTAGTFTLIVLMCIQQRESPASSSGNKK